jgi:acid stress-induced BolA-like protein IbaG/YrbA
MQALDVKELVEQQLDGCEVITAGEGCDFQVTVVGDIFQGLTPVKKQQLVYGCLNDHIASGAIHALTIRAYTPQQWQAINN